MTINRDGFSNRQRRNCIRTGRGRGGGGGGGSAEMVNAAAEVDLTCLGKKKSFFLCDNTDQKNSY